MSNDYHVPLPEGLRSKAWAAAKPVALAEWAKGSADTTQMLMACSRGVDAALVAVLDEDALLDNEGLTLENERMRSALEKLEQWDMLTLDGEGKGTVCGDAAWARKQIATTLTPFDNEAVQA